MGKTHSALDFAAKLSGGGLFAFAAAALQVRAQGENPTTLWISASACLGILVVAGLGWLLTRSGNNDGGHTGVGAGILQSSGAVTAGRDIYVGLGREQPGVEPAVRITPAVNGKLGFIIIENPAAVEKFSLRIDPFSPGNENMRVRPRWWRTATEEQALKKGEIDWCHVMTIEPDKVPISYRYRSILGNPVVDRWLDRRERHVRLVRFLGEPADQDIEVEENKQYSFYVTVLSDTRDPAQIHVTYAVTPGDMLVMPFDERQINALNEEAARRFEEFIANVKETSASDTNDAQAASADGDG